MDGKLSTSLGRAAATQPSDDGMTMSNELYRALVEGRMKEAMALLPQSGAVASAHQVAGIHDEVERNNVLHLAARHGHHELIQELYANYGDKSLLASQNSDLLDTPLHCAVRAGHERAVSLLVKFAQEFGEECISILGCKNKDGDTALHLAARSRHHALVEVVVSAAPELASEVNGAGESPLYLAVTSSSVLAVRAITSRCSDASASGRRSQNALHAAVFKGSEMVGLLLDWKPSLASEADDLGSTPLHFASYDGDHWTVDSILRAVPGRVVRMKDSGGMSALHVAAGMGHSRVAKALMDACPYAADLRDNSGGTFVHAAARGGYSKVMALAIKNPTLRWLLDMEDREGNTPLHLAVAAGKPLIAAALLRNGEVRANARNNEGHTPLDLAARSTSLFSTLGLVITLAAFGGYSRSQIWDRMVQWRGKDIVQWEIEKTFKVVIAVLIITVALAAAAFNMPGSYQKARHTEKFAFKWFLFLDWFALVTSLNAVRMLVSGKVSCSDEWRMNLGLAQLCIWVSLMSMLMAFRALYVSTMMG